MEFVLDKNSPLPPLLQIQEQIKLALLFGRLRPGDTLPSIRDVEKQIGISRNIVRNAYLALQRSGILILRHGKGVLVEKNLLYGDRNRMMEKCQGLCNEILDRVERLDISPSSFARYLFQQARDRERTSPYLVHVDATKALALERAAKISSIWQLNVPGFSFDELASMDRADLNKIRSILTNYIRLDEVRRIVKGSKINVIPLSLAFAESMRAEFHRLPSNASVVLVLDDRDYPALSSILENYRKILVGSSAKLSAIPRSRVRNFESFVKKSNFDKIIFSNRIWEEVSDKLKKNPRVTRPRLEIDLASLESARIEAGVVI
jgi:DNA-binding transcriptional regulator YhcF (GntR family)